MPYNNFDYIPLLVAIGVAILLALLAIYKKVLTVPATAVSVCVLIAVSAFTGYAGLVAFGASFAGAAVIGFIGKKKRTLREEGIHEHKGPRSVIQVLVNSVPSVLFGLIWFVTGKMYFLIASCASVAEGFADSAASDIGILSDGKVVDILTFKPSARGFSGGVSALGTVSALVASAYTAGLVLATGTVDVIGFLVIAVSAFIGTVIDSVLGSGLQAVYRCSVCGKNTESSVHCGENAVLIKGIKVINNDVVNATSSFVAGAIACAVYFIICGG